MIIIIDDEIVFANNLKKELTKYYEKEDIIIFDYFDINFIKRNENKIEILFLDIELGKTNGVDEAQKYRSMHGYDLDIVFVSFHDNLMHTSFRVSPVYFIRKEKIKDDLPECLKVIEQRNNKRRKTIKVDQEFLKLIDIMYIESMRNNVFFHTKSKIYRQRTKISKLEIELQNYNFVRTHLSYLVNVEYIKRIDKKELILTNGISIPISRKHYHNVFHSYVSYNLK